MIDSQYLSSQRDSGPSTLSTYRILFIDRRERVTAVDDFDAVSKSDALEVCAQRQGLHYAVELWLGGSLVARRGPPRTTAERQTRLIG
jgi:hypothetical protein